MPDNFLGHELEEWLPQDATTVTEDLNSGTALVADAAYMFTIPWRSGDSINIRYSVTAGTTKRLLIDEIGAAE